MKGCILRCLWVPIKSQASCLDYRKLWLIRVRVIKHNLGSLSNGLYSRAHKHTNMLWAQPPGWVTCPKLLEPHIAAQSINRLFVSNVSRFVSYFLSTLTLCREKGNKESCVLAAWAWTSYPIWEKYQLEEARQTNVSAAKRRGGLQGLAICKHASCSRSERLPLDSSPLPPVMWRWEDCMFKSNLSVTPSPSSGWMRGCSLVASDSTLTQKWDDKQEWMSPISAQLS